MKLIGKKLTTFLVLIIALGTNVAMGAVSATLDRDRVSLGDTVRLTIVATDGEELDDADLRPLTKDFNIVGRSTNSNTSIVNGRISHSRKVIIDLMPTREGNLQIPSIRLEQSTTAAIPLVVGEASDTPADGQPVVFEAEVDRDSVYVQGQVILTLRVQQSVNLEGRGISELKLDNAFVKPLEQHSFQRTIDGRQWRVDEVRYAIFPEQSGSLEIPAQVFSGRISRGTRSFFDIGGGGKLLQRSSQPITINVLPKPASVTAETWLPAQRLTLQESWSTAPENLRVGESATRTIQILGEGLQGAQLPPILFTPIDGLKYYPDQPQISEREIPSGLEGVRQDSAAVVPTRPGTFVIPEIRIPWWDTQTDQLQYAVLPEREITIVAAGNTTSTTAAALPPTPIDIGYPEQPVSTIASESGMPYWKVLAVVSTLGWVLTLIYLWRRREPNPSRTLPRTPANTSEKKALKDLLSACAGGNATDARRAIITWAASLSPVTTPVSLNEVARQFGDKEFTREITALDACLYSPDQSNWDGTGLANCVRRLRKVVENGDTDNVEQLRLYPESG
jgi:hypothetical protein